MGEFYEPETSRFFVHNFFLHEHPEMMELFGRKCMSLLTTCDLNPGSRGGNRG